MKLTKLPISKCQSHCPKCRSDIEFCMFESGPGGDFETYLGITTGATYRIDMIKVHYLNKTLEELLNPAIEKEGGNEYIRHVPSQTECTFCKHVFNAVPITFQGETTVNAVQL
jgi:hypothetical protein